MIFDKAVTKIRADTIPTTMTFMDPAEWTSGLPLSTGASSAMKVAAVNACVEIRSDSIGKLPLYIMDRTTKKHLDDHYLKYLLAVRPNEAMTPFVFKKLMETYRLLWGNAYAAIVRSPKTGIPIELIPLPADYVTPIQATDGSLWYVYSDPNSRMVRKIRSWDIIHLKAYTEDGIHGISVLSRASEIIDNARAQQQFEGKFYTQNARPSGILAVEHVDLSKPAKDKIREEWNSIYSGVDNAFKIAVLDNGIKYQQISMSQKDAQFIESKTVGIEDIARFFNVPLYKLQAGKQSYSSNEQNAIEYVVSGLHPSVTQYEEEYTFKLLFDTEIRKGLEVRVNMNAELRGDMNARGKWYTDMRNNGAYSVNDILDFEDLPAVPGGDTRIAPLNSVPLEKMGEYFDTLIAQKGGTAK